MNTDVDAQLLDELNDLLAVKFALVLVPAQRALQAMGREGLAASMGKITSNVSADRRCLLSGYIAPHEDMRLRNCVYGGCQQRRSAMLRRTWEATPHAMLVLEGLKGTPVVALGPEQQLRQAPYDPWRDQGLAPASNAGEVHEPSQREARVAGEQARLKPLVGERTRERNNSDAGLGCADPPRPWSPNARKAGGRGYGCAQLRPRGGAPIASGPTCTSSSGGRSTRNGVGG